MAAGTHLTVRARKQCRGDAPRHAEVPGTLFWLPGSKAKTADKRAFLEHNIGCETSTALPLQREMFMTKHDQISGAEWGKAQGNTAFRSAMSEPSILVL